MSKSGIMQLCDAAAAKKYGPRLENLIKTALLDDRLSHIFSLSAALSSERGDSGGGHGRFCSDFCIISPGRRNSSASTPSAKEMRGVCFSFSAPEWVGCTQDKEIQMQFHYLL
jgi:hypothetical protein